MAGDRDQESGDRGQGTGVREPEWPAADVIIGNPPFLGGKKMRTELGDEYVDALRKLYDGRVPARGRPGVLLVRASAGADRSREGKASGAAGDPRRFAVVRIARCWSGSRKPVTFSGLESIGNGFWTVRPCDVSMVGFDNGAETDASTRWTSTVQTINSDLTAAVDLTAAQAACRERRHLLSWAITKGGHSTSTESVAQRMLSAPVNPNGRPNSDVVRPWVNGMDITGRPRGMWIIDFGVDMSRRKLRSTSCRSSMCASMLSRTGSRIERQRTQRALVAACETSARTCEQHLIGLATIHRYTTSSQASSLCLA